MVRPIVLAVVEETGSDFLGKKPVFDSEREFLTCDRRGLEAGTP